MDVQEISKLRSARPFKPFNLVLGNGRKLPVDQPYYVGFFQDYSAVLHVKIGDGLEIIHPDYIVGVDYEDPAELRWKGRVRWEGPKL